MHMLPGFRTPFASLILRKTNTSSNVRAPTRRLCPVERYWDVRSIYQEKTHLSFTNRREISPGWSLLDYRETRTRARETERETNGCRSLQLSLICDDNGCSISDTGDDFPLPITRSSRVTHPRSCGDCEVWITMVGDFYRITGKFRKIMIRRN